MASPSTPNALFTLPAVNSPTDQDLWGDELNANFNVADTRYTTRNLDNDYADFTLSRPVIKDYAEKINSAGGVSGAITIDYSLGNHYVATLTGNVTSVTITNVPASGVNAFLTLELSQNGTGNYTFAWPSLVKWVAGTAPVITPTASYTDYFVLKSRNAFSTAMGIIAGQGWSGL